MDRTTDRNGEVNSIDVQYMLETMDLDKSELSNTCQNSEQDDRIHGG